MSGIVTGEAVALDLRVARAGSRAVAFFLDWLVVMGLLIGAVFIEGQVISGDAALAIAILLSTVVLVIVGYPTAFETLSRGKSLGKLALGLRVVRDDGGPVRFRQSFVRGLLGLFELYLFFAVPALIASLASSRGKRIGDLLAGTVVLQERVPAPESAPVLMPPPLATWAAGADLSQVPDSLALAARQYLGRARSLTPAAAMQMEAQLAQAVFTLVAPPPPPGTPGWALLAAVVAERRRREEQRLGVGATPPPPPPPAFQQGTAPPYAAPEPQQPSYSPQPTTTTPANEPGFKPPA